MNNKITEPKTLLSLLDSIVIFRGVSENEVLEKLRDFLSADIENSVLGVKKYCDFVSALFNHSYNLSRYLLKAVSRDENPYVLLRSKNKEIPPVLESCVKAELAIFSELSKITDDKLKSFIDYSGYLPGFESEEINFASEYESSIAKINQTGYGIYAKYTMFRVEDGAIVPVKSADTISIEDLTGCENQRAQIILNTKALLQGKPAANTLLCGDAGTGKSSGVKAVINMLAPEGVRLIEIRKEQLRDIPVIMEKVRDNPLKFVFFIDDLSFNKNDDNFSALKAILEGSASVKADNTVIYATSNRRHLVKETFGDREGDDVHRRDTMQELLSLSERFGLVIYYEKPEKKLYLEIVRELAKLNGIEPTEKLEIEAEAFALRKGGRSPRTAEQFIDAQLVAALKEGKGNATS